MGQQPESTAAYPGTMTFGTAQRLPKPGKSGVPGPGAHSWHHSAACMFTCILLHTVGAATGSDA
jgi:hypothetical protein